VPYELNGYMDVATRLDLAFQKYPDLRIQETRREVITVHDTTYVAVQVTVWRTPDDPLPAIAESWEVTPGRSSFTRNSEYENASTSAVGRALRLAGIGTGGPIASADEVRVRQSESPVIQPAPLEERQAVDPAGPIPRPFPARKDNPSAEATPAQINKLKAMMRSKGINDWTAPAGLTKAAASDLIDEIMTEVADA